MRTKVSGVYLIYCHVNKKAYVGSSRSINGRLNAHRCYLRAGTHSNQPLQNAWNLYGEDEFSMGIVHSCEVADLFSTEQQYIYMWSHSEHCFNVRLLAESGIGVKWSEEAKAKASARVSANPPFKGRKHTDSAKALLSERAKARLSDPNANPFYGKSHTDETKQAIAKANKGNKYCVGRPATEKCKQAVSAAGKIRVATDVARAAARHTAKTLLASPEVRAKAAESLRGRKFHPDVTAKMANSARVVAQMKKAGIPKPYTTSYVRPSDGQVISYVLE